MAVDIVNLVRKAKLSAAYWRAPTCYSDRKTPEKRTKRIQIDK